jgi:hypothetical protein
MMHVTGRSDVHPDGKPPFMMALPSRASCFPKAKLREQLQGTRPLRDRDSMLQFVCSSTAIRRFPNLDSRHNRLGANLTQAES